MCLLVAANLASVLEVHETAAEEMDAKSYGQKPWPNGLTS